MTKEEIYEECEATLDNDVLNSILFYFSQYRNQREEFAEIFKQSFCSMIDQVLQEIIEQEEE